MASEQRTSLLTKLHQIQCHFTWGLKKGDADFKDLQNRLEDDINFKSETHPEIKELLNFLAFIKFLEGRPEEALDNLRKAEEYIRSRKEGTCEKTLIVTYGNFAWLHYHMNDCSKTQSYLNKLEEIKNTFPTESPFGIHAEVYGEMGSTFLKYSKKYYEKAKECFKKALKEQPDNTEWNTGYAIALYRTETESTCADNSPTVEQLRRTLELDPKNAVILVLLGLKLASYKQLEEAAQMVEKALQLSPEDPHVTRYVAKFFRQHGLVDKSISLLKRALEQTATSAFLHHQIALCYKHKRISLLRQGPNQASMEEAKGLLCLAVHHLDTAVSLRPSFVYAMVDLATLSAENKNREKAEELFQKAFKIASDDFQKVLFCYGQFQLYHKKSESEAIKHFMKALEMQTDTPDGKKCAYNLEKIATKRISRNERDSVAFGILAYVHQVRGEKHQAVECYEKALSLDPGNEEFLTALCDLRLSLH